MSDTATANNGYTSTEYVKLTGLELGLFCEYAKEAHDWDGHPMVDQDRIGNGLLTSLKKKGLLTTWRDEGITWINFTDLGKATAAHHAIEID